MDSCDSTDHLPAPDEILILDEIPDDPAKAAAEWLVRLSADDVAPEERAALQARFEAWKQADPRQRDAADRMSGFISWVSGLRSTSASTAPAHAALDAVLRTSSAKGGKRTRAKRFGATLALILALAVPTWIGLQAYPPVWLMADVRTAAGQWETRILEDGSRITMGSAGAVNLRFDAGRRVLELVRGEILVEVARDPARPFLVETAHGSIRALGTRFEVSLDADATVLTMLESRVSVQTASQRAGKNSGGTVVSAGQRVRIAADGLGPIESIDARSVSDAWKFHRLVVQDRPLPEVLDALSRYRPGRIRYDRAQLEGVKVSAVLPLDDTDRALQLLAASFPAMRVRTLMPYLVLVDVPPARP